MSVIEVEFTLNSQPYHFFYTSPLTIADRTDGHYIIVPELGGFFWRYINRKTSYMVSLDNTKMV